MATFNQDNAEQLIYSNEYLTIEVLGGVRLEGLDRMRVTLKVSLNESEIPSIRHNLDLYNDTQLEKFIRKIAERLEIGTSTTAGTLAQLTQLLETYRLEKIKEENQADEVKTKPLTEEEREEAIAYLQNEALLKNTETDLGQSGIIGELMNAMILYIAMTSRKTNEPLSVVCLAKSGTGKSYLMDMVARCIPEEDKKEQTQFTGNAFYYFKRNEISGKVFIVKDLEGALTALFPIRELQSEKKISKTITRKGKDGKLETITLVVEGPVSVIACTTQEAIYEDNANRSILIYLDDSKEQDERILNYQKLKRAGLVDSLKENEIRQKLQNIQKALQPIKVINPYAPLIDLPESIKTQRRMLPILLSFIEAITFYHQHQREQLVEKESGEVYIESTPQDVENGFMYLQDVLFRKSDELNGAVRNFYEKLKIIVEKIEVTEENQIRKFKVSDIKKHLKLTPRSIQIYFKTLAEYQYLQVVGGKQRTGYEYELLSAPSEMELQKEIDEHLKIVLGSIQRSHAKKYKKETMRNNTKQANFAIEQQ